MGKSKELATRVGIDDNADATAITITSQENVGIGTASPSNYGTAYTSLGVSGSSASCLEGFVGNTLVGYMHAMNAQVLVGSKTNVPLKLVTNDTIQMTIDGSGHVTMPNQPSVSGRAIRPEYGAGYATTGVNLYFNDMTHNNGNHFNNSTGVWTCPVAGRYFCYAAFLLDDNHSAGALARFAFLRNGNEFFVSYNHDKYGSSYGGTHTTGGIFNCAANDTITCKATHGAFHVGAESSFSICLLG